MCCCEVRHRNYFGFRDVQFLGEYLCVSIDEKGLSACLCVNGFNDIRGVDLSYFGSVLSEKLLHLDKRKISQTEFILDIEWRDGAIVVKLRDALDTDDTKTVRTSRRDVRDINMSKRV